MQLTKLGHACLHLTEGDASVLIDPGAFSAGFEDLRGLTAILITHQHFDHLDLDRIGALVEANPQSLIVSDPDSAVQLGERGITAQVARAGDSFDTGGLTVSVYGEQHAVIHADVPIIPNVGYLVGAKVFHPGDSFTIPDVDIPVLGLPTGAPWLKAAEVIDYLRAIAPPVAIPIHDATLAMPEMDYRRAAQLAPAETEVRVVPNGESTRLP